MGHIYHQEDPDRYRETPEPRKRRFKGVAISVFFAATLFVIAIGAFSYEQEIRGFIYEKFGFGLPMGNLVRPDLEEEVGGDSAAEESKKIYSWVDEKGVMHFSNLTAPEDSDFTAEEEASPWQKKTKITIDRNVIYVPVEIRQGKKIVATKMILDTGSNKTAVYADFADQLGIKGVRKSRMMLADGKSVVGWIGVVTRIKVGSKYINNKEVMIIDRLSRDKRISGLLGQDFLGRFSYKIDTNSNVIIWD